MAINFGDYARNTGPSRATQEAFGKTLNEIARSLPSRSERLSNYDSEFFQKQFNGMGGQFIEDAEGNMTYQSLIPNENYNKGLPNFIYEPKEIDGVPNPNYKGPLTKKLDPKTNLPMRHHQYKMGGSFVFKSKEEAMGEYLAGMRRKFGPVFAKKMGNPLLFSQKYDQFSQLAAGQLKQQILDLKASNPTKWTNKKIWSDVLNKEGNEPMMSFMRRQRMFEDPELAELLGPHTYWGDPETSVFGEFDYGKGLLPTGIPGITGDPNYWMSDTAKIAITGGLSYLIGKGIYNGWSWTPSKNNPNVGVATSPDGKQTKRITRPDRLLPHPQKQLPPVATKQLPPIQDPKRTVGRGLPDEVRFPGDKRGIGRGTPRIVGLPTLPRKGFERLPSGTPPVVSGPPKLPGAGVPSKLPGPGGPPYVPGTPKTDITIAPPKQLNLPFEKGQPTLKGQIVPKKDLVSVYVDKFGNIKNQLDKYRGKQIPPDYQIVKVPKAVVASKNPGAWRSFIKENFGSWKGWKNILKGGAQYYAADIGGQFAGRKIAEGMGSDAADKWGDVGGRAARTSMDVYFTNRTIQGITGQSVPQITKTALNSAKSSVPKMASMFGKIYRDKGVGWILKKSLTKAPLVAARLGLKSILTAGTSPTVVLSAAMAAWTAYDAFQLMKVLTEAYQEETGGGKQPALNMNNRVQTRRPRLVSPGGEYKAGSGEWMRDMEAWRKGGKTGLASKKHAEQFKSYLDRQGIDWNTFFKKNK